MSSKKSRETTTGTIREENLFYELGYKFSRSEGELARKPLEIDVILYLVLLSIFLQIFVGVRQTFTITVLIALLAYKSSVEKEKNNRSSNLLLITALIANIADHTVAGIIVRPGVLFDDQLTFFYWLIELIWAFLFGLQLVINYQPYTPLITEGLTVQAESDKTRENYTALKLRLENTDYTLDRNESSLGYAAIRSSMEYLLLVVFSVLVVSLLLDAFIWRVIGSLGGGINILEEYFLSGLVLILFLALFIFSDVIATSNPADSVEVTYDNL